MARAVPLFDTNPPRLAIKAPYLAGALPASRLPLKPRLQEATLPASLQATQLPSPVTYTSLQFWWILGIDKYKKERGGGGVVSSLSSLNLKHENPDQKKKHQTYETQLPRRSQWKNEILKTGECVASLGDAITSSTGGRSALRRRITREGYGNDPGRSESLFPQVHMKGLL